MQVEWDNAGRTAIRVIFEEPWDWTDLDKASALVDVLLGTVPHRAAIVLDMQTCQGLPEGYLWQFKRFYEHGLPNAGPLVLVARHNLISTLAGTLDRLPNLKRPDRPILAAATLEAARVLLRNERRRRNTG